MFERKSFNKKAEFITLSKGRILRVDISLHTNSSGNIQINKPITDGEIDTAPLTICCKNDIITWRAYHLRAHKHQENTFIEASINDFIICVSEGNVFTSLEKSGDEWVGVCGNFGFTRYNIVFGTDTYPNTSSPRESSTHSFFKIDPYVSCNPCSG
ncbi:MAG TPA: hypothetical protein VFS21_34830 [Roseiflexaceae bacterium]|nr:hypothetical protein [Roseiflexaceae bacterium]